MKRRFIQGKDGELVEVSLEYRADPCADYHVMPDIQPYRSMADGSVIGSRSHHRAHLRQHGCIEVGNETKHLFKPKEQSTAPGLHETIRTLANERLRRI